MKTTIIASFSLLLFSLPTVFAQSIGIKFVDGEDVAWGTASAGAPGFEQENWNFFSTDWSGNAENDGVIPDGMVDSTGTLLGAQLQNVTYGANADPVHYDSANTWRSGAGNGTADDTLMNGYLDDGQNNQPYVNLSIAPGEYATYSVVVYIFGDVDGGAVGRYWLEEWTDPLAEGTVITDQVGISANSWGGTYEQAGGAFSQTEAPTAVDIDTGNYIVFQGVTARNLRIRSAGNADPEDFGRGPLNAIQIIDTTNDEDNDGLPDAWEIANMFDPDDDGTGDPVNGPLGNPDGDGLTNLQEYERGTNPRDGDTDGDTLADEVENDTGIWVDATMTGTSPRVPDTDGDGFRDDVENCSGTFVSAEDPGTDPNLRDSDGDNLRDEWEVANGFDPTSDVGDDGEQGDVDTDMSPNIDEQTRGTDPNDSDSDDDNLLDGAEDGGGVYVSATMTGTDPLDVDSDNDTLTDDVETGTGTFVDADDTGTDPNKHDTDDDLFRDDWEIANGGDPFDGVGLDVSNGAIGLNLGASGAQGTNAANASLDPAEVAGVAPQANWNNLLLNAGSSFSLLDATGADSGAEVSWATDEEWSNGVAADADGKLLVGWLSLTTANDNTIDITGIPFAEYDLVVYFNHDRGTEDVDLSETNSAFPTVRLHENDPNVAQENPFFQQSATAEGDASQVGNFYYIPGLSASDLNLVFRDGGDVDAGSADRGAISAIQLIATGGGADFAITDISTAPGGDGLVDVTVTWSSQDGVDYFIYASDDLQNWSEISDFTGEGATASHTEFGVPATTVRRYYRIQVE